MAWKKKTDQPRGTKVDVCEEKMGGRAGGERACKEENKLIPKAPPWRAWMDVVICAVSMALFVVRKRTRSERRDKKMSAHPFRVW